METSERERIKKIAIDMVIESGLINLSRAELCNRAGIADGSFSYIMGCNFLDFIKELKNEGVDTLSTMPNKVIKTRTDPTLRKDQILSVAISLSLECGYHRLKREEIAQRAGVSMGLVNTYFGSMPQLKRVVMRAAIKQGLIKIIAQGLKNNDPHAMRAPKQLRVQAERII